MSGLFHDALRFPISKDTKLAIAKARQAEDKGGGPAALIRIILGHLSSAGILTLEEEELLKVRRYGWKYGSGTYEQAFRAVIRDARAAGWDEPPSTDTHETRPGHRGRRWDGL